MNTAKYLLIPGRTACGLILGLIALAGCISRQPGASGRTHLEAHADDYFSRGNLKRAKGDSQGAIADYSQAIKLKPDFAAAYNNRGNAKRAISDFGGALADFTKAIEIQPDYALAYVNRGLVKPSLGDVDGAIADFTKATEIKPDFAAAYYSRGVAKRDKGDKEGAIVDWTKALQINPDYADARKNLDFATQGKGAQRVLQETPKRQPTPEDEQWDAALDPFASAKVEAYLQRYPLGRHASAAHQIVEDEQTIDQIVASGPGSHYVLPSDAIPPFISSSVGVNTQRGRVSIDGDNGHASNVFGQTMLFQLNNNISSLDQLVTMYPHPLLPCGDLSVFVISGKVDNIQGDVADPLRIFYSKQYGVILIGGKGKVFSFRNRVVGDAVYQTQP